MKSMGGVDLSTPDNSGRTRLLPVFLVAAALVWMAPLFWTQVHIDRGGITSTHENTNLYRYVYPTYHYAYGRVSRGELPLWNPNQLCGTPLHTDPGLALFHPLHLPFCFLPTAKAMAVHGFLCLFLMGLGAFLAARALRLDSIPSFLVATIYAFCGASAAAVTHPPLGDALAVMPFAWFLALLLLRRNEKATFTALLGLCLGLCALSSAAALIVAMCVPFLAVLLLLFVAEPDSLEGSKRANLTALLFAVAIGLAISAIQWAPMIQALLQAENPGRLFWNFELDAQAPTNLRNLLVQFLLSKPGSLPRIAYVGIPALLLLPAAMFHRTLRTLAFGLAASAAACLALYLSGGLLPAGFPARAFAYPLIFALALLAGLGADRLMRLPSAQQGSSVRLPAVITLVWSLVLFYASASQVRGYVFAFLILAAIIAAVRVRFVIVCAGILLVVLTFTDLSVASVNVFRHPLHDAPQCYERYEEAVKAARERLADGRALISAGDNDEGLSANLGSIAAIPFIGGGALPLTKAQAAWWRQLTVENPASTLGASGKSIPPDTPKAKLISLMATRLVMAAPQGRLYGGAWQDGGPPMHLVETADDVRLYVIENALPRAYWVPRWRSGPDALETAIDAMTSTDFLPGEECIVSGQEDAEQMSQATASSAAGLTRNDAPCSILPGKPEEITIQVEAPTDGVTVLLDTFAPGWIAQLDGETVPRLKVNGLFTGIATPAGRHEIVLRYRPLTFVASAGISLAAAIGALLFCLYGALVRGEAREGESPA